MIVFISTLGEQMINLSGQHKVGVFSLLLCVSLIVFISTLGVQVINLSGQYKVVIVLLLLCFSLKLDDFISIYL